MMKKKLMWMTMAVILMLNINPVFAVEPLGLKPHIVSPMVDEGNNSQIITFTYFLETKQKVVPVMATIYHNNSGLWVGHENNETPVVPDELNYIRASIPNEGDLIWNINVTARWGPKNELIWGIAETNYTLTIDRTPPDLIVWDPTKNKEFSEEEAILFIESNEFVNGSFVVDDSPGNTSMFVDKKTGKKKVGIEKGEHKIKFYIKDKGGNIAKSDEISFVTGKGRAKAQSKTGCDGDSKCKREVKKLDNSESGGEKGPSSFGIMGDSPISSVATAISGGVDFIVDMIISWFGGLI